MNLTFFILQAKARLIGAQLFKAVYRRKLLYYRRINHNLTSKSVDRNTALNQNREIIEAEHTTPADNPRSIHQGIKESLLIVKISLLRKEVRACQHFPCIITVSFKRK